MKNKFPNLKVIAITLRGSINANHNTWSGVAFEGGRFCVGPTFDITHILDRVGGGDAFCGGLIYGLRTYDNDLQKALDFAVSASCLKHSIFGDFNMATVEEVEKLMKGEISGRVSR
jgi:2-dehydro-3-deoxygluconokinase